MSIVTVNTDRSDVHVHVRSLIHEKMKVVNIVWYTISDSDDGSDIIRISFKVFHCLSH